MPLPVSSTLIALAAIALVALSFPVSLRRLRTNTAAGDGGDEFLRRLIRTQGNYIEYAPIALLAIAAAEMNGAAQRLVCGLALSLIVGRAAHVWGMLKGSTPLRGIGMILTYVAIIGAAAATISSVFS